MAREFQLPPLVRLRGERSLSEESYRSSSRAKKAFLNRIKGAIRVVRRGIKRDRDRKAIGDRAVIIESDGSKSGRSGCILWISGDDLILIESRSLRHALLFENRPSN